MVTFQLREGTLCKSIYCFDNFFFKFLAELVLLYEIISPILWRIKSSPHNPISVSKIEGLSLLIRSESSAGNAPIGSLERRSALAILM